MLMIVRWSSRLTTIRISGTLADLLFSFNL